MSRPRADRRLLAGLRRRRAQTEAVAQRHRDLTVRGGLLPSRAALRAEDLGGGIEAVEAQARYVEPGLPHRVGGQANPVQGENDPAQVLLFQLASDRAMGWMWGDVGALYVTMSPRDLKKHRFDRIEASIDGH